VLSAVFAGLCKPLLTLFHDPIEKCRETSVTMVTDITAQMTDIQTYLPYIIPICVMRLGKFTHDVMTLTLLFISAVLY